MPLRAFILLIFSTSLVCAQTFSQTGPMKLGRASHTATLLTNGTVLVTGGDIDPFNQTNTAEIYNPVTGTWRYTNFAMNAARSHHEAIRLMDGTVLIAGGSNPHPISSAEIFDPVTEHFILTGSMSAQRQFLYDQAVLLNDGRVMVLGNCDSCGTNFNTAEIFNPLAGTWSLAAPLPNGIIARPAVLLHDGRVFVSASGSPNGTDYIYTPGTNSWQATVPMVNNPVGQTATTLLDGRVLIVAGRATAATELYDPLANGGTGQSLPGNPLSVSRSQHTATLLPNGDVLVNAGYNDNTGYSIAQAELFDHLTGTWTAPASMRLATDRLVNTATLLPSGQVLVAGGFQIAAGVTLQPYLNSAELWGAGTKANPVVLAHGYCSDPSAFGNMAKLLRDQGIHVYPFNYASLTQIQSGTPGSCPVTTIGVDYSIEQIGSCFSQFIQDVRRQEAGSQVDVITHSEGGTVARAWMAGLSGGLPYAGEISRLATIGTPHYGQAISF